MRVSHLALGAAIAASLAVPLSAHSAQKATETPAARALSLLKAGPSAAAHRNDGDAFAVRDVMLDANGTEHVRMDRTYRGLPVFGGDVVVHSRNGALKSISKTMKSAMRPNLDARIGADAAIEAAGMIFGPGIEQIPTVRKVIYARGVTPLLAWEVRLQGTYTNGSQLDMTYYVNANSGNVLLAASNIMFAKPSVGGGSPKPSAGTSTGVVGTGRSLMNGAVVLDTSFGSGNFSLIDTLRGGNETYDAHNVFPGTRGDKGSLFTSGINAWGDSTTSDNASVAADAHYGLSKAWDYFNETHGRKGVRGDGQGSRVFVHVRDGWANASWQNNTIYLGDGDASMRPVVSLDLVGHELSHGVTEATAKLVYSGESGGLNEGTSDIFGTMVEFFANNPDDAPDYMIGEKLMTSKPAGRYMYKPSLDGKSPDCYTPAVASMNPHQSSGIANHFFYLLAEGAVAPAGSGLSASALVCNGNTVLQAIGRDAAQRLWYQALTRYMTSGTTYADARAATISAASDLGYSTSAVAAAWSAVNVN